VLAASIISTMMKAALIALMIEAASTSETSSHLHTRRRENLRIHILKSY
jgi:hypothetical protein